MLSHFNNFNFAALKLIDVSLPSLRVLQNGVNWNCLFSYYEMTNSFISPSYGFLETFCPGIRNIGFTEFTCYLHLLNFLLQIIGLKFLLQITSLEIWKPPSWRQLYSQDIWRGCWGNFDRSIWPEMDEVHNRCPSRQEGGGRGSLPGTSLASIPNRSRGCLEDITIRNRHL